MGEKSNTYGVCSVLESEEKGYWEDVGVEGTAVWKWT
jgi:hypothetical protein